MQLFSLIIYYLTISKAGFYINKIFPAIIMNNRVEENDINQQAAVAIVAPIIPNDNDNELEQGLPLIPADTQYMTTKSQRGNDVIWYQGYSYSFHQKGKRAAPIVDQESDLNIIYFCSAYHEEV